MSSTGKTLLALTGVFALLLGVGAMAPSPASQCPPGAVMLHPDGSGLVPICEIDLAGGDN